MMIPTQQTQTQSEIEAAMAAHIATLRDAFYDLLSALLTVILGIVSIAHALIRMTYALTGMIVWMLGVWIVAIQALRAKTIARSSTSPFRLEVRNAYSQE